MMRTPVRIGLIGCGKVTERLALPQLAACADAQVAALVDVNRAAARRLAQQFGIDRRLIWTDWRRMLREAAVEAVGVCVPTYLHAEVTIAALQARQHVMVEKPIALTLAEADAMIAAAQAARRYLMVEQTQRFDPVHRTAHRLLRHGAVGRVLHVHGRLGHAGPEYWSRTSRWFTSRRHAGGGALMDLGAHLVDLLRWLSGNEVTRICCQTARLQKRVAVEDNSSALLEFADGTTGSFEVSWTTRPYRVATAWYGTRGQLHTTIGGLARPVALQLARRQGDPNHPAGPVRYPVPDADRRTGGAYAHFVRAIARQQPPSVPGAEGRRTLAVILAGYRSAQTGRWVELE